MKKTIITLFLGTVALQGHAQKAAAAREDSTVKERFIYRLAKMDIVRRELQKVNDENMAVGWHIEFMVRIKDSSDLQEDRGKNIALGFVDEDIRFHSHNHVYIIKYDKSKNEIISVDTVRNHFTDEPLPVNSKLPKKQG